MKYNKKVYYKLEVLYNKYVPIFVAFILTLDNFFDINDKYIHSFEYLFVPSILTMLHMFISRVVLEFCKLHRVIVDYVFLNIIYRIIEVTPFIPKLSCKLWYIIHLFTLIICIIILIYIYASNYKRVIIKNNRKY